jgi:hypothetical protein
VDHRKRDDLFASGKAGLKDGALRTKDVEQRRGLRSGCHAVTMGRGFTHWILRASWLRAAESRQPGGSGSFRQAVGAGLYGPRNYATEQVSPTDARAVAQVVFGSPAVDLGFEIAAHSDIELDGVGGVAWDGALLC